MASWQAHRADLGPQADPADAEASALFEQHRARVYRFCMGRLGDREEAADAVQDTYAKAWLALRDGAEVRQPLAWLLTIAGNVCADRHRARRVRPVEVPLPDDTAATVTHLSRLELAGLPAALRSLPEGQRRAFVLRELRGCSYEEICEDLGASHSSVAALLHRARRSVATTLAGAGRRVLVAFPLPGAVRSAFEGSAASLGTTAAATVAGTALIVAPLGDGRSEPVPPTVAPARPAATSSLPTGAPSSVALRVQAPVQAATLMTVIARRAASPQAPSRHRSGANPPPVRGAGGGGVGAVPTDAGTAGPTPQPGAQPASSAATPAGSDVSAPTPARPSSGSAAVPARSAQVRPPAHANGNGPPAEPGSRGQGNGPPADPGSQGNGSGNGNGGAQGNGPPADPGSQGNAYGNGGAQGNASPDGQGAQGNAFGNGNGNGEAQGNASPDDQGAQGNGNGNAHGNGSGNGNGGAQGNASPADQGAQGNGNAHGNAGHGAGPQGDPAS